MNIIYSNSLPELGLNSPELEILPREFSLVFTGIGNLSTGISSFYLDSYSEFIFGKLFRLFTKIKKDLDRLSSKSLFQK